MLSLNYSPWVYWGPAAAQYFPGWDPRCLLLLASNTIAISSLMLLPAGLSLETCGRLLNFFWSMHDIEARLSNAIKCVLWETEIADTGCDNAAKWAAFLSVCFLRALETGGYGKILSSLKSKELPMRATAEKGDRECSLAREQCACVSACACVIISPLCFLSQFNEF